MVEIRLPKGAQIMKSGGGFREIRSHKKNYRKRFNDEYA